MHSAAVQLFTQVRNMHIHGACLAIKIKTPRHAQQLFAAEYPTLMFGHCQKQVEFLCAEIDYFFSTMHFTTAGVDRQITHSNLLFTQGSLVSPAPQDCL